MSCFCSLCLQKALAIIHNHQKWTKDGEFTVVNPTAVQGAGTTGERNTYSWRDTTTKPNTVYYYQIEDASNAGERERLATVRLKGLVFASRKLLTKWADLKQDRKSKQSTLQRSMI